jgi:hypothetical protein
VSAIGPYRPELRVPDQLAGLGQTAGQEVLRALGYLMLLGSCTLALRGRVHPMTGLNEVALGLGLGGCASLGYVWLQPKILNSRFWRNYGQFAVASIPNIPLRPLSEAEGREIGVDREFMDQWTQNSGGVCAGVTDTLIDLAQRHPSLTGRQLVQQFYRPKTCEQVSRWQFVEHDRATRSVARHLHDLSRPAQVMEQPVAGSKSPLTQFIQEDGLYRIRLIQASWIALHGNGCIERRLNQFGVNAREGHSLFMRVDQGRWGFCDINSHYFEGFATREQMQEAFWAWLSTTYPAVLGSGGILTARRYRLELPAPCEQRIMQ